MFRAAAGPAWLERRLQMRESWEESWLFTQQVFLENYYVPGTLRIPEGRDNKQRNVENDAAVKKIKQW